MGPLSNLGSRGLFSGRRKTSGFFRFVHVGRSAEITPTEFCIFQTVEAVDVYSFGHVLFEMTFGTPLLAPSCDAFPESCPDELSTFIY